MNHVHPPSMRDADDVIDVAQRELEQLVCHDASSVTEAKKRMIGKDRPQTHRTCVQDALMAQITERCMAMHNLNLLANEDLSEQWKGAEDCRESRAAIYHPVWKVVDLDPVREVSNTGT